jgi:glucose/arabinose dehydrogenase
MSWMRGRVVAWLAAAWAAVAVPAEAHGVLRGFVDELVVAGLEVPVAFARLPDGRVLVAEKAGVVRVVRDGQVLPDAFIDLRDRVNDYWDRGLLGIAADPAFADTGYVYLFYVHENDPFSYTGPKTSRLIRVTADGDTASVDSLVVLLGAAGEASCLDLPAGADCIPADGASHNGGALRFGPDGTLWVATGDASSFATVDPRALRAQDLDSLAGKLLRVGRDGRGLPDNPFWTGDATAVRSRVWAYGFRNPFRFTLRPSTGRPYVGDVGAQAWEELNVARPGGNHGWPCYEGPAPQPGYQQLAACQALMAQGPGAVAAPLTGYPHRTATASITGGAFYTGTSFPDLYRGVYFFGDFSRETLHYVAVDADDQAAGPIRGFATGVAGPVDVQTDAESVWYLAVNTGELHRIRHTPDTGGTETHYLGDAPALLGVAANGAGPVELDRSHGGPDAGDGGTLRLADETFAKGLGVRAPSDIRVPLGGQCSAFHVTVGIDDETRGAGSVTFEVWLDGARVAATGMMTARSAPISGTLDVSGRSELRLVVTDAGDGTLGDHADWADARLECARPGGDQLPPVVTVVSPRDAAAGVPIDTLVTASFSEALAASSVTTASVQILVEATTAVVPASVAYDADARQAVLTPALPLAVGTGYVAVLSGGAGGLRDLAGNTLVGEARWRFTTASPVVNQPPVPVISAPAPGRRFRVGDIIAFAGSASDAEDGTVPNAQLRWAVSIRHCPGGVCHTHPLLSASGGAGSVVAPDHGDDSFLVITLTATDSGGAIASTAVEVHPEMVTVTLLSEPAGLQVVFGETRQLTPATVRAVVGGRMSLVTPSPQHSLSFTDWSSGEPRAHVLTIGETDATYVARFTPPPGVSYLSDLSWTRADNGAGPVKRNRSHGGAGADAGGPLSLRGVTFAKGLGVRAPADIRFTLNGACSVFATTVGLDDEEFGAGSVSVEIWVDGVRVVTSGLITGLSPAIGGSLDITGARELRLVVTDGGDGNTSDHVDWADARVTCAGPGAHPPAQPSSLSALAAGLTAGLSWPAVPGAASYRVEAGSALGLANLAVIETATPGLVTSAPTGTYYVRVRAINAWGESAATADVMLVVDETTRLPDMPGTPVATVAGRAVQLTWLAPTAGGLPSGYVVEAGLSSDTMVPVFSTSSGEVTAGAVPPGTYFVRVRAVNAAGVGPATEPVTVVVP